jgi:hypothetical protein
VVDLLARDNFMGHLLNQLPFEEFQKELHRIAHEDIQKRKLYTCQFNPNILYAYSFEDEIMLWVEIPKYADLAGRIREFLPLPIIIGKDIAMNFGRSEYDSLIKKIRYGGLDDFHYIAYITGTVQA